MINWTYKLYEGVIIAMYSLLSPAFCIACYIITPVITSKNINKYYKLYINYMNLPHSSYYRHLENITKSIGGYALAEKMVASSWIGMTTSTRLERNYQEQR